MECSRKLEGCLGTYRLYSARFKLLIFFSGGRRWLNLAYPMHTHDHWVLDHEGHFVVMSFNVIGRIMHVPTYEMRSSCKEFDARHIEVVDMRCYAKTLQFNRTDKAHSWSSSFER